MGRPRAQLLHAAFAPDLGLRKAEIDNGLYNRPIEFVGWRTVRIRIYYAHRITMSTARVRPFRSLSRPRRLPECGQDTSGTDGGIEWRLWENTIAVGRWG
jgi:hypothetical protein